MNNNDKISIEYESRVMIEESTYLKIVDDYTQKYSHYDFTNINYYYDTPDYYLLHHSMVLRKRVVNNDAELTLKIKGNNGDKEITSLVNKDIDNIDELLSERIRDVLLINKVKIHNLKLITVLKTERIEIKINDYLFVIDKNYYNNKVDYNLEVEATSKKEAERYLAKIIKKYAIKDDGKYISKSRRAMLKL